ncbi:helix-turn-helix domain-containing protein [Rhodobacter capsulatus]|uniref:helix-turn-helix domain-containing protein n=1 Tax=Rhodobacter capsulatus TaxID=1061 RepID=UPI004025D590
MEEMESDLWEALERSAAFFEGNAAFEPIRQDRINPVELRRKMGLTQAQMAPMMGMSLSGYRKWEQGQRTISGPAAVLLRVIETAPEAVKQALAS